MNQLSTAKRAQVIGALVEGNSINSTCRMLGVGKHTALRLLEDAGIACAKFHDKYVRNLRVRRLQCDEIWSFVGAKEKNVKPEREPEGWGDVWTWTGIDADTKMCVGYLVGGRDAGWARDFTEDCASRIKGRVQLTADGLKVYLEAVEGSFGCDVDYAQLQKIYGAPTDAE
jgi:hypothetical protein